jgi:hypothetical protein
LSREEWRSGKASRLFTNLCRLCFHPYRATCSNLARKMECGGMQAQCRSAATRACVLLH